MEAVGYILGGIVVYLSTALGLWLTNAYREEIDRYEDIIERLEQITFIAIWTSLGWIVTSYLPLGQHLALTGILFSTAAIGSMFIVLRKHIVFTILSAAYILAAIYSTSPFTVAALIFVFGALTSVLEGRDKPFKRVMLRRLPFFILVLFGYLLSFLP